MFQTSLQWILGLELNTPSNLPVEGACRSHRNKMSQPPQQTPFEHEGFSTLSSLRIPELFTLSLTLREVVPDRNRKSPAISGPQLGPWNDLGTGPQSLVAVGTIPLSAVYVCLLLPLIAQLLPPPFLAVLSTCPLTGAAREDFSFESQADSETWQLARCTSTHPLVIQMLSSFYGSWTPHFDLKECMAREYVTSQNTLGTKP
ncbi:unnamed protein product [Pleuronectes platessa]|uniref:Uncharacterized protein n=1 Tax=Pleuronectes platessa TaxID=8262 RepID=A0A9N7ZDI2_PLEPL|nr:unnamed protein product [Pleuronectes platessa]